MTYTEEQKAILIEKIESIRAHFKDFKRDMLIPYWSKPFNIMNANGKSLGYIPVHDSISTILITYQDYLQLDKAHVFNNDIRKLLDE